MNRKEREREKERVSELKKIKHKINKLSKNLL
jgi:hypothetical protein